MEKIAGNVGMISGGFRIESLDGVDELVESGVVGGGGKRDFGV